jgi:murein DD-endopeptidase MepM/ murein hydrolase activator NlpD
MSERTFKVDDPHMRGDDVKAWQHTLNRQMQTWNVAYRIPEDGDYGVGTRDLTASVCHGMGLASASEAMKDGVTPALRVKLRNKNLTAAEKIRFAARAPWRAAFRKRYAGGGFASPVNKILAHSWGYHPGVHDGVDLICPPNAVIYALCDAEVFDVRSSGWWGKAPSGDVSKGDGIIQLRCLADAGPFKKGLHFGYGHAEHAVVRKGDKVKAGDVLGNAGLAVAWHVHFMCNGGGTDRGVGDRDPWPYVEWAIKHS